MKKNERRPRGVTSGASTSPLDEDSPRNETNESMDLGEIKELIDLIFEKQFNEFELQRGSFRLYLKRSSDRIVTESNQPIAVVPAPIVESRPRESAPAAAAPPQIEETLHIVTSPIVGTFYRASSPTAEPYVKSNDQIEKGDTLCIIEAMKLMNEIQADISGVIVKIFVDNGQPVEYGQPLFGIKV